MNTEGVGLALVLGVIGLLMLLWGALVRVGKAKSWWLLQSNPVVPRAGVYVGIPLSLFCFFIVTLILLPLDVDVRRKLFMNCGGPLLIATFVFAVWRPYWLTPKWLRWLEENHSNILPLLKKEARQMGSRDWERRIRTQEGLEEWVAEVRRKHGLAKSEIRNR